MVTIHPQKTIASNRSLNGNETLSLAGAQNWQIAQGAVGIFAVQWRDNEPCGPRHYLFTLSVGEMVPGVEASAYGLVAIAFEPTELSPVSPDACRYLTQLGQWFDHFSAIASFPAKPALTSPLFTQYLSLSDEEQYAPGDQHSWISVKRGTLLWLGDSSLPLTEASGLFPLCHGTWLQAKGVCEIEAFSQFDAMALPDDLQLARGKQQFHRYALTVIERIIARQHRSEHQQFKQRQQLNKITTEKALKGLASLLEPEEANKLAADTPLLVAAGAVAHVLGVEISPPSASEDPTQTKEPLDAIARASKLRLRQVLLRGQWWTKDNGPMVAYLQAEDAEDRIPVALLPVKGSRYELLHSKTLVRSPVDESLATELEPTATFFYRPLPDGDLNAITLLKFAFHGRSRDLLTILATGIITSLLGMAVPQATAILIDEAIPYGNEGLLFQLGLALLAVAFGRACFQFAQAIATMRIETGSDATLQAAVWDRLLKLHTAFFRTYSTGDLQSRVSSITAIRRKLSGSALDGILSGTFALLNLALLFYYSARLTVLALFVACLVAVVTILSGLLLLKKQRPLLELDGELYGLMVQLINGVSKLRIAGAEPRAFAQWGEKYRQQLILDLSTQRIEDAVSIFNNITPTLTAIGLFALSTTLLDSMGMGSFTAGTFLAFNAAFAIFISGATRLSYTLIDVLDIIPLWQRAQPILSARPEVNLQKSDPGRLSGQICLESVTFRYREDGPLILNNVSIQANPGEFIALVGPSGSGKSTVLRLLLGFETPISGTVYYDHQDISGLDITAVRRQLGVVLQNGRISAGTIFENISGGAIISLDDAWRAARMAGFAEDLESFPMQMHTVISEGGGNLSGGQRQRLIIARALALNPKILLLDEATSALDNRTQAIVSESLDALNVTRIVVAHRLSTIRHADRIYVIKSGRVVQQGTFDELAEEDGTFAQLIKRQVA